jgi:protein-tyrosine phosphatase
MDVLFVCLGDTCRSPLAKGILKKEFAKRNISGNIESAGFEPHHIGHPVDKRTLRVADEHGIDLSEHTMRMFSPDDFDRFDHIYVMDQRDYNDVEYACKNPDDMQKVDFVMNLIDEEKRSKIIPDPLYKGYRSFEKIYEKLEKACAALAEKAK